MSDTGYHSGKPPKYDGKGERSFKVWIMKHKAWLHNTGYGDVPSSAFDGTLPATEGTVLDLTDESQKAQSVALAQHSKAVNGCILAFKMPELMIKIIKK